MARIDYRGTSGYGRAFLKAGDYQISSGMVDDLIEGVDYLINQKLADPERVALFGRQWGGLVGIQALVRSPRFKVWLNRDTKTLVGRLDYGDLALSSHDNKEVLSDLGGRRAAKQMLEALNPKALLSKITIPSFHYYSRTSTNSTSAESLLISDYVHKHPGWGELVQVHQSYDRKLDIQYEVDAMDKMFGFLVKHMPVK